ncbi:MAG TPA: helix-turn-helix transcriptional regulator [Pyrinomonadaceae bacterium]|nr:helix-turn-helix transcriptional regulator [Pyrinomonadaceae bacterium]
MLYFNISRLMQLRGIDKPYAFLVKNGFVTQTATNMINDRLGRITPDQMEKLCLILNCTPNDLFDWRPDENVVVSESHALHSLKKEKTPSVAQMVKDLPVEKLAKLHEIIDGLKKES